MVQRDSIDEAESRTNSSYTLTLTLRSIAKYCAIPLTNGKSNATLNDQSSVFFHV